MADSSRLEQLRRRVLADPASIAFAALAEEYRRARRFADAIQTARAGLTRHPSYVTARVTLGRALLESGALDEARRELEQALAAAPENLAAIRALAELHRETGALDRARDLARRGVALAPQDRDLRVFLDGLQAGGRTGSPPEGPAPPPAQPTPAAPEPTTTAEPAVAGDGPVAAQDDPAVAEAPPVASPDDATTATEALTVVGASDTTATPADAARRSSIASLEWWLDRLVRERLRRERQRAQEPSADLADLTA